MKRVLGFLAAAALGFSCFAAPAKIATQEWVKKALAGIGVRVSTSTVETNITASATGGAQTNIVFTSPYTCEEVPQCRSISFTVSPAKTAYRQAMTPQKRSLLDLLLLKAYADGQIDKTIHMVIQSGYWVDDAGNAHEFLFDGGWVVELQNDTLPDPPAGPHVCQEFDINCVCKNYGVSPSYFENNPEYKQYADVSQAEFTSAYGSFENWIDLESWGTANWQEVKRGPRGNDYYILDDLGYKFNVKYIFEKSDAFIDAISTTVKEINAYMKECRDAYVELNTCDKKDPQHKWLVSSCGDYSWKRCANSSAHSEGAERHSYPGRAFTESTHSCMCGKGPQEAHGVLVSDGRVETERGWIETKVCPKGCGYYKERIHEHHFTNCGYCDAGDECNEPCTGCGSEHAFGKPTKYECAKCECKSSQDCNARPPDADMSLHAAWLPCGEDTEDDNDWLEAKGGHCQCQCKTFGHIARTEHDYVVNGGLSEFEEIQGDDEFHYRRLGECTRCGQHKKQKESHEYPEEPTDYDWVSDDNCRKEFICTSDGCEHSKYEKGSHKLESAPSVFENISATVCRRKTKCQNCDGYKKDDSHGHERDASNKCACKNKCGFKFDHRYEENACGISICTICKTQKEGVQQPHSDFLDANAEYHACRCGELKEPHLFGGWTKVSVSVGVITYTRSCLSGCGRKETKNEVCEHDFGEWVETGRTPTTVTYVSVCKVCGAERVKTVPLEEEGMECDDSIDFHIPHQSECGCVCGKYGAGGAASAEKRMHKWSAQVDAYGVKHCMCKCGRYHEQRTASTYMVNLDKVCGNVCAYCREKAGTGVDIGKAADTMHTPNEVKDGTCGCKCGALDHSSTHEMFHIQKPGSCCCLGADGKGGAWHFRMPKTAACSKICADKTSFGGPHLRAGREKEDNTPRKAEISDHDKYDGSSCGCECREYNHSNYSVWSGVGNLHNNNPNNCGCYCGHASESQISPYHRKRSELDCECMCEVHKVISHVWNSGNCLCNCSYHEKEHKKVSIGKCLAVCHGSCGESTNADKKGKHTPNASFAGGCGCECGKFSGSSYDKEKFPAYHVKGSGCLCLCSQEKHYFEPNKHCPRVCAICGGDAARENWDRSIHTFGDKCICNCGKYSREHNMGDAVETGQEQKTCEMCQREITVKTYVKTCQRSGCDYSVEFYEEEGHALDCGGNDPPHECSEIECGEPLSGGGKCGAFYCPTCHPVCPDATRHANHHGGNGSSGGDGDLDDI